jgi:ATP-dependent DNA helicase RecQ
VEITPRRMWPAGLAALGVSGKISPEVSAEPGRALGRLTDLGWGPRLRALLGDGEADGSGPDGPVPGDLVAAVVKVLAAWDWAQRPAGVVTLPSRTRPALIGSLAAHIAEIGRIPNLGALGYRPGTRLDRPAGRQYNSAQRLTAVWRELTVPEPVGDAVARLGGPVLLVDDRVESGWTMTVAAKLVREAGAPAVLPFALAVTAG